jgi:hypothetical protein
MNKERNTKSSLAFGAEDAIIFRNSFSSLSRLASGRSGFGNYPSLTAVTETSHSSFCPMFIGLFSVYSKALSTNFLQTT